MFTFSFGSAFAATAPDPASTNASDSQAAFSKFIADTLKTISYDGNGYATNISEKRSNHRIFGLWFQIIRRDQPLLCTSVCICYIHPVSFYDKSGLIRTGIFPMD